VLGEWRVEPGARGGELGGVALARGLVRGSSRVGSVDRDVEAEWARDADGSFGFGF
jgi:hypothetical protein